MQYSGAGGKLIHQKNQKQKILWHCPFNAVCRLLLWLCEPNDFLIQTALNHGKWLVWLLFVLSRKSAILKVTYSIRIVLKIIQQSKLFFCLSCDGSPKHLSITLRPFRIFSKIRGDIRGSRCTTGVNDTGGKWKKSSSRKIVIILFGHLWVVELT